jgi:hypothetical protein
METQIQSFATFSETRKAAIDTKIKEEASTKRTTEAQRFADLLAEYEVTTVAEIAEEQRTEFFAKLVGETDEVETEGNAFGAAVKKAKEEDKEEFKVGGETYKVKESVKEGELNEGVHPKIKKAMKAIEKGETVYGENVRFPGRFKIIEFTMGGAMALVDYENGTDPYEMAAMNIALDKMKFESVVIEESTVTEARAKYVNTQKTVDGNPLISFNSSTTRAKWMDENKSNVISVPKSTVINSDQGRVVGSSRGPYYLIVKADVLEESKVEEAEVKSDEDFMEMAMTMYKEAFGDDFDEAKAKEAAEGMLKKADGDYGAAVGMLQSSLG